MFGVNPYSPYGYSPMAQPQSQPSWIGNGQASPSPAAQGGPEWIMASSIKQVEQVSVQPGGKAWVMVQNEPVFALRSADQMGLVTTSYYRFEKYDPDAAQPGKLDREYITREELESRLNAFAESLKPIEKEGTK